MRNGREGGRWRALLARARGREGNGQDGKLPGRDDEGWPAQRVTGLGFARSARGARKGKGMRRNGGRASRMDKEASARCLRIADGRRVEEAQTATVAGMGTGRHRGEHRSKQ